MGGFASKQWNEMTEVNDAIEENEKELTTRNKKSLKDRIRTRILRSDPRSASEDVDRTPIAVERQCETPVRAQLELEDPRSPGVVSGGEMVLERTPLLVMQKSEDGTPARGAIPPPFSLPSTPYSDSPRRDSPLLVTSTPATIPLVQKTRPGDSQPANLLQERLREAAVAAMKETAEKEETAAAAADMEAPHNDSSLII
eukprot:GFUD01043072.1.p1 GENE.GFUD01043072.1~~GFUD01043072.1.p1  ORF type:complete len:199 (-),score=88.80 GFUD01043072.1:128-724(-)